MKSARSLSDNCERVCRGGLIFNGPRESAMLFVSSRDKAVVLESWSRIMDDQRKRYRAWDAQHGSEAQGKRTQLSAISTY